jgi:hypothetical protein
MQIFLRGLYNHTVVLNMQEDATLSDLLDEIKKEHDIPKNVYNLLANGRVMYDNDKKLVDYGLMDLCSVEFRVFVKNADCPHCSNSEAHMRHLAQGMSEMKIKN